MIAESRLTKFVNASRRPLLLGLLASVVVSQMPVWAATTLSPAKLASFRPMIEGACGRKLAQNAEFHMSNEDKKAMCGCTTDKVLARIREMSFDSSDLSSAADQSKYVAQEQQASSECLLPYWRKEIEAQTRQHCETGKSKGAATLQGVDCACLAQRYSSPLTMEGVAAMTPEQAGVKVREAAKLCRGAR